MNLQDQIEEGVHLTEWIGKSLDGYSLPKQERFILATGCFHIVVEHHRSIVLLIDRSLHGSAMALLRPLYESLVRGLWLHHCASESELASFRSDRLDLTFEQLVSKVEKVQGWDSGLLSQVKSRHWKLLNSFTHSGFSQVSRRFTGSQIDSNYSTEDLVSALRFSGSIAVLTGIAVAGVTDDVQLGARFLEKAKSLIGAKTP